MPEQIQVKVMTKVGNESMIATRKTDIICHYNVIIITKPDTIILILTLYGIDLLELGHTFILETRSESVLLSTIYN